MLYESVQEKQAKSLPRLLLKQSLSKQAPPAIESVMLFLQCISFAHSVKDPPYESTQLWRLRRRLRSTQKLQIQGCHAKLPRRTGSLTTLTRSPIYSIAFNETTLRPDITSIMQSSHSNRRQQHILLKVHILCLTPRIPAKCHACSRLLPLVILAQPLPCVYRCRMHDGFHVACHMAATNHLRDVPGR